MKRTTNKYSPYYGQKSFNPPTPNNRFLTHFSSQFSKKSLFRLSAILAPLLLSPFSVAQAASFGVASCSTTSTTACIGGTYFGSGITVSVSDTLDTTPDKKQLKITGVLSDPGAYFTLNANNSILDGRGNFTVNNGSKATFNFKNSAYEGSFTLGDRGGYNSTSKFTFDGNYQGTSDDAAKGYAYIGNITASNQTFSGTFSNDANMKGNITFTDPYTYISTNNISFTNSSLEGNIIKKAVLGSAGVKSNATISFSGNSSKGFAMKGNINNVFQNLTVNFSNQAKMMGNIILQNDKYGNAFTSNINFNNASLNGGINLTANGGTLNLTGKANSKLNITSLIGTNGGFKDKLNLTLDNSTLQGSKDDSAVSYTNTNDTFSLNATGGSKIYMNLTANQNVGFYSIKPQNTINLTGSQWIGNLTVNTGTTAIGLINNSQWMGNIVANDSGNTTLTLTNSTMSGNVTGKGIFKGNFTTASIGNITNSNSASVLNFSIGSATTSGKLDDHTIGNINFSGKITGSIINTTMGNLNLTSNNGISNDLTLKDSFLKSIVLDSGASLKFSATGSTIGDKDNTGNAINNNWGTFDATLDSTTVNGNIVWSDASFTNTVAANKGLNFTNKSTLNGNITAPKGGNYGTTNTFSFDDSAMNGNIIVNKKTKGADNTVNVNFTGNSTFTGDITGDSIINATFDASVIKSNNITGSDATSTLIFKGVKDSTIANIDFAGAINGDLSHSDIGNLKNANANSSLTLSNAKTDTSLNPAADASPINMLGDVSFAGTLNATYYNSVAKSFSVSGTTNLSYSDGSKVGTLNVTNGTSTLNLANQSTLGALNVTGGKSTVNLVAGSLLLSTIDVSSDGAFSSVNFSSNVTGDNSVDFTKSNAMIQEKLATLLKANQTPKDSTPDTSADMADSAPVDFPTTVAGAISTTDATVVATADTTASDTSTTTATTDTATAATSTTDASDTATIVSPSPDSMDVANGSGSTVPTAITADQLAFLSKNLTSRDILAYLSMANISAYAGDINTQVGINNVDFKDALYLGGNVNTTGGTANITMSFSEGLINKLQANPLTNAFLYQGDGPHFVVTTNGENATNNIALSGNVKGIADFNYIQGNTNIIFADTIANPSSIADASSATTSTSKQASINGNTYQNGIYVSLDAAKADSILGNYRNLFPKNTTTFKIDKVSNPDIYSAIISGAMVGEVSSLPHSGTADTSKSYEAIFAPDAVFIGKINIADRGVSMNLSQGSKLILEDGSNISVLSGGVQPFVLNHKNITGDSIYQENTIVDLATGGNPSSLSQIKDSYSTLNIGEVKNLNNALFRVSYNPFSAADDEAKNKSDHIIINSALTGNQTDYLQAYQNSLSPVLGNLSDKNILVLSVKNDFTTADGSKTAGLTFNTKSSVLQGYDLIETIFDKKVENSSTGNDENVASGADADTDTNTDTWTNYYIASAQAQITQSSKDLTQAAISSNYSIFLANINDLNKRLGELRDNTNAQGVWARVFNGMSTSNRGEEVKTYSTNVQVGYDVSLPNSSLDGKTYLGFALSYGYNKLGSQSFDGKANLIELGAYYSYVGNTGFYNDMILKYAYISNDLTLQNNENSNTTFDSSTVSLGEELGYRFYFNLKETKTSKHSLYLEPNAEFILGYVGNGGFDQVNGNAFLDAAIDNILAFRGRVGGVLGYSLKTAHNQTDFRLGISYVGDIVGGGNMNFKTNFSDATLDLQSNQMALVSLGVNSILSDQWKVYADLDTSFGGKYYNQNYLVSVGGRYAFGKKTRFIQNNRHETSTQNTSTSSIKEGYYFDVYTLAKNAKLSKDQMTLLSKYPYVISLEKENLVDPKTKTQKTIEVQKILIGPFKTKEGAQESQEVADEVAKILNKKEINASLREVK